MHYLKIFSSVWIDNDQLVFDYDRQEEDPDEHFRYEYFFELEGDPTDEEIKDFGEEATSLVEQLKSEIGEINFYYDNQTNEPF